MAAEPALEKTMALGVGLTNACDLSCGHCYRGRGVDELDARDVLAAVEGLPVRAVNFGTGESGLHPQFESLVRELARRGVVTTLTTNGFSSRRLPDDVLGLLSDVEFSIDYPTREDHDRARGPGNWDLIEREMARCASLGVSTTVISVMMSTNYRAMPQVARLAGSRGALLRVNVYQPVRSDLYTLSYDQFWEAWGALLATADVVACGEPILRAVLGMPATDNAGCGGRTVRLTPRGGVVPCVYGADEELRLDDLRRLGSDVVSHASFTRLRVLPAACVECPHRETCRGGCASRRAGGKGLAYGDPYCPWLRGREVALRAAYAASARPLPKALSACTTILRARELAQ